MPDGRGLAQTGEGQHWGDGTGHPVQVPPGTRQFTANCGEKKFSKMNADVRRGERNWGQSLTRAVALSSEPGIRRALAKHSSRPAATSPATPGQETPRSLPMQLSPDPQLPMELLSWTSTQLRQQLSEAKVLPVPSLYRILPQHLNSYQQHPPPALCQSSSGLPCARICQSCWDRHTAPPIHLGPVPQPLLRSPLSQAEATKLSGHH